MIFGKDTDARTLGSPAIFSNGAVAIGCQSSIAPSLLQRPLSLVEETRRFQGCQCIHKSFTVKFAQIWPASHAGRPKVR